MSRAVLRAGAERGHPNPPRAVNLWRKKILCQCIVWPKVVRKSAGGEARGDTEKTMDEKVNNNMRVFLNSKLFLTERAEGSVCSLVQEHSQALGVQPGTPSPLCCCSGWWSIGEHSEQHRAVGKAHRAALRSFRASPQ